MPTGYTNDVAEGKITELKPFILRLARGMGALYSMRDDPWDAPIPDKFEPTPYYKNKIVELQAELDHLDSMSVEDAAAKQDEEIEAAKIYGDSYIANIEEKETRYRDMILKVQAWEGAPEGIKEFAIDQLYDSLKCDCGTYRPSLPEKLDPVVWMANKIADVVKDLNYAKRNWQEELDRVEARSKWVKQLKESLNEH